MIGRAPLTVLTVVLFAVGASAAATGSITATAKIAAAPGQNSTGKGKASLLVYKNGTATISVTLTGSLPLVTMSHIHLRNASAGNPIVYGLMPNMPTTTPVLLNPPLSYRGSLSWVTNFTVSNMALFKTRLTSNLLYVNVHTVQMPGGAVQGFLTCKSGC